MLRAPASSCDEETGDGNEAIEKIGSKIPDIIFLDIRLPGKNGLELTREHKNEVSGNENRHFFSNLDLPEYRTTASKCGADYFSG